MPEGVGPRPSVAVVEADERPAEAVFEKGRSALQMVFMGGEAALCRGRWLDALGRPPALKPVAGYEDLFCAVDKPECFT